MNQSVEEGSATPAEQRALVAVGSTRFDDLIDEMCSPACTRALSKRCITQLVVQIGEGKAPQSLDKNESNGLRITFISFVHDFKALLQSVSLVICHAGAGCSLEAVRNHKPAIVVPNEKLMNNHQLELARELHRLKHCKMARLGRVAEAINMLDVQSLELNAPSPDGSSVQQVLDRVCCGLST